MNLSKSKSSSYNDSLITFAKESGCIPDSASKFNFARNKTEVVSCVSQHLQEKFKLKKHYTENDVEMAELKFEERVASKAIDSAFKWLSSYR